MAVTLRRRTSHPDRWIGAALAGALGGFLVGWLAARRPGKVAGRIEGDSVAWHDRLGERIGDGFDAAAAGLRGVRARFTDDVLPDEVDLEARLALVANAEAVRVEHLGDGIVELTGTAPDPASRAAAASVARVPGVRVVVNRIWTPTSAAPSAN